MKDKDRFPQNTQRLPREPRLYQQVAEKLIGMIELEEYEVGMRLPAERELATMLGVSRPTIREAVIALELAHYVEVRMGSGVYVLEYKKGRNRFSDQDVGPFELTEARALFEGEAVALAATMITDEQLVQLAESLDEMVEENAHGVDSHEVADKKFHMIIAQATNNSAIRSTIENLWEMRESSALTASTLQKARNSGLKPSVEQHRDIYNALKARDATAARQAMRSHLLTVIESILEATEADAIEAARNRTSESRDRLKRTKTIV
ncbi:Putative L-lactate dehydrogenase operon regulatory protein [Halioglobus japonicus]|nr:Putative L-lactate dehydrogenase operon regulatory protein [Halioglobus japonicus]